MVAIGGQLQASAALLASYAALCALLARFDPSFELAEQTDESRPALFSRQFSCGGGPFSTTAASLVSFACAAEKSECARARERERRSPIAVQFTPAANATTFATIRAPLRRSATTRFALV